MSASPLGLGDITLHSALNQPLNAGIELTALGQTRSSDITVKLASAAAFESAGLDRSLLLTTIAFEVASTAAGTPYIKVTSTDAVKEPFLDFLVEIDWPSGHLLREYTLLLDPPVLIDEEPLPVESAVAGESAAAAVDANTAVSAPDTAPLQTPAPSADTSGIISYGTVQRADTLWSIASQLQTDDTASVEQVMMALLKSNPEAFYNSNINELKAGYVLRVSDPALLTAMTRAAAAAEVRRQNEQWMDSKRARAGMAGAAPQGVSDDATGTVAGAAASGDNGPRLRLSVPDATATGMALEGVAGETEPGTPSGSELLKLKQELTAALESSEASRQENVELRERLAALQEQIDSMQRLTTLQDDTLAALQAGAGEAAVADQAATESAASNDQAKPAKPGKAAAKPAPASSLDSLLDDPRILAIGGGAAVLLISLVWLVVRRRRSANSFDEMSDEPHSSAAPAWATAAQTQTMDTSLQQSAAGGVPEATAEAEESGLDLMQTDEDEIDVLAEADVYLAYRRFDKAEELLRDAIKVEPGRRDLILKLLEVQVASGNKAGFIAQAESFKQSLGSGDGALWDKVVAMGKRIAPEHVLFGGSGVVAVAAANAAGDQQPGLSEEFSALELDADITAELDRLGGSGDDTPAVSADSDGLEATAPTDAPLFNMDLSLDDNALSNLSGIDLDNLAGEKSPEAGNQPVRDFGNASNVIDFESRTGLGQGAAETQEAAGSGLDRDLAWLTGVGEDLDSLGDADETAEDDFSNLISGEDEVGTKLDLAKAYIDMGDQDSARNILGEVVQEGTQDQQREANELMRQIG